MDVDSFMKSRARDEKSDGTFQGVDTKWLSEQWVMLEQQPWFRGFVDRHKSQDELRTAPIGTFVVRVSESQPGHYAITTVQERVGIKHILVLPSYAGRDPTAPGATRYRLGKASRKLFNTVPKLIAYYISKPYHMDNLVVHQLKGAVMAESQSGGVALSGDGKDWQRVNSHMARQAQVSTGIGGLDL